MTTPVVAVTGPIVVDVEAGQHYWWRSCGKSAKQPCGAHKGSAFAPVKHTAPETGKAWFCTCKRSAKGALCDGSHKKP
ncbi:MAG: CDGSH iron-sulfur domain-containing protein [Proteobacteria bacterium]|nr:CDGSH iron-sulfur domain-containing protein [Pseudomonadota bacterium]